MKAEKTFKELGYELLYKDDKIIRYCNEEFGTILNANEVKEIAQQLKELGEDI